jgi:hypothetical protein
MQFDGFDCGLFRLLLCTTHQGCEATTTDAMTTTHKRHMSFVDTVARLSQDLMMMWSIQWQSQIVPLAEQLQDGICLQEVE